MNTASRIETNGKPGKIQISQETANLLVAAGKQHWLTPREDKIVAKGKGELQTFWLSLSKSRMSSDAKSEAETMVSSNPDESSERGEDIVENDEQVEVDPKTQRLIRWNVETLLSLLRRVALSRGKDHNKKAEELTWTPSEGTVITEVREIIHLPHFDASRAEAAAASANLDIDLGTAVEQQLHDYVAAIASMYHFNPFHNFEHASHVTMSVVKLLSRIVAPDVEDDSGNMDSALHE